MVQLDHDEEMGFMQGMYGTLDGGIEVQRTIKRAELTAFLCLLWKAIGPTMIHVDNKGIIDGLVLVRKQKTLVCGSQFWEECKNTRLRLSSSKSIAPVRKGSKCRSLKSLSRKAIKKWMS